MKMKDEELHVPSLYWNHHLHKNPYKQH